MSRIWWDTITGPVKFIRDLSQAVIEGKQPRIIISDQTPFLESMRYSCESAIQQTESSWVVEHIDCSEEWTGMETFEQLVLKRFAKPEVFTGYRPVKDYFQYAFQNRVFSQRIIWIKNVPIEKIKVVIDFQNEFSQKRGQDTNQSGCIVLEIFKIQNSQILPQGVSVHDYSVNVSDFDHFLFASVLVSNLNLPTVWQNYLVYLANSLSACKAELTEELLSDPELFRGDPTQVFAKYSLISDHDENAAESTIESSVNYRIWQAQLKSLFHVIEEERFGFLHRYRDEIEALLPITDDFDEKIINIEDVELRLIRYLIYQQKLPLITFADKTRLFFLSDMRNQLAHLEPMDYSQVCSLIGRCE